VPTDPIDDRAQKYRRLMQAYDAHLWSGRITPQEFIKQYRHHSKLHHEQLARLHNHHPHYMKGPDHLAHRLEALYDYPSAKRPDGTLNHTQLRSLEADLRNINSYEQNQYLDWGHRANRQRYHGLDAYHQTHDAYEQWMESWCEQYGIQLHELDAEISHLLGLSVEQQAGYLAQHPEILDFEDAKQRDWDKRPHGYMHNMFHGQHGRIARSHSGQ